MARSNTDLLKLVNGSGYPLQLAVARLITASTDLSRYYSVRYAEHHWHHPSSNEEGFIDLVLTQTHNVAEIVVECKRVQDTDWIFLIPAGGNETTRAKGLVSRNAPNRAVCGWYDLDAIKSSPESEFCVIVGESPKDRPVLERLTASVIESTEVLASEDVQYQFPEVATSPARVYFSAIVTTAKLKGCNYKPASLNADSGTLADAEFTDLPFVRFRKQLSATLRDFPHGDWAFAPKWSRKQRKAPYSLST